MNPLPPDPCAENNAAHCSDARPGLLIQWLLPSIRMKRAERPLRAALWMEVLHRRPGEACPRPRSGSRDPAMVFRVKEELRGHRRLEGLMILNHGVEDE